MKHALFAILLICLGAACRKTAHPTTHPYPVAIQGKWGYVDAHGTMIITPQYDAVAEYAEGLAAVKTKHQWGYIDATGTVIAAPQFDAAGPFAEGLAPVRVADRMGYIRRDGAYAIPPQFDDATQFHEGLAAVRIGAKWGLINRKGAQVIGELSLSPQAQTTAKPPQSTPAPAASTAAPQPELVEDHLIRARSLFDGGQLDEATAECDAALNADPSNQHANELKTQIENTKKILGYK